MIKCIGCQKDVSENAKFCPYCGRKILELKQQGKKQSIFGLIGFCFAILGLFLGVLADVYVS